MLLLCVLKGAAPSVGSVYKATSAEQKALTLAKAKVRGLFGELFSALRQTALRRGLNHVSGVLW
jgi:hypothetical protein